MAYQRSIPILVPLSVWLLCQLVLWRSDFLFLAISWGTLIITLGVKYIFSVNKSDWPLFLTAPLLFFFSFLAYATIIINRPLIHFIFLTILLFLFFFFRNLYYYSLKVEPNRAGTYTNQLKETIFIGGNLSVFAGSAFLFGLPAFLNLSIIYLLLMMGVMIVLSYIQTIIGFGLAWSKIGRLFLINALLTVELAAVLYLLPLNFNIIALFLGVFYFLGITIIYLFAHDNFNRHSFKGPLTLGVVVIVILLFSSRWL